MIFVADDPGYLLTWVPSQYHCSRYDTVSVERKYDADWVKGCTELVVEGTAPVDRPR